MRKSKALIGVSLVTIMGLTGLTGCSQQVKLETGITNNASIKSCAYDITASVDASGLKNTGSNDQISSMLSSGKVALNFNGKVLKAEDREKLSSVAKISVGGVSFESPIYVDTSTKKLDFDLLVGVPDVLKSSFGDALKNVSNFYLSSKDLDNYMREKNTAEEYKQFQDSMNKAFDTKDNKNSAVSKEMLLTLNSYISKNKAKVETFAKLGEESATANGVYTIKLSKDDIKAIAHNYLGNEKYYSNLQAAVKDSSGVAKETTKVKADGIDTKDAKTVMAEFDKSMDSLTALDITTVVTIENKFATKTDVTVSMESADGKLSFNIDSKLSDINKITAIQAPDKNDKSTLNIMDMVKGMIK